MAQQEFDERAKENIAYLQEKGFDVVPVLITRTGLEKSNVNAIMPFRKLVKEAGIHDFAKQQSGQEYKVSAPTNILTFKQVLKSQTTMYKTKAKDEARMWFGSAVNDILSPNDVVGIMTQNQELYILNLSKLDLEMCVSSPFANPIKVFIKKV